MLKTVNSVTNAIGALNYKGTWDASTNTPTLVSSVGTKGDYYVVSVAGNTNLNGETLWGVGDWAVFNGSIWQKVDGGDTSTVNSLTVTSLTGYMYANNSSPVTASTTIPNSGLANSSATVGNTVVTLGSTVTSIGNLTLANVTVTSGSIPNTAITGLGTMATQNANAVVITGGTINTVTETNGKYTNANVTSVAVAFPNSFLANSTTVLGNATLTLGSTTTSVGNLTLTNVTIPSGTINVTTTNQTANTASNVTYTSATMQLIPAGYINLNLNGVLVKVPYYNA